MSDGDNEDLAKIAGMPVETGRPVLTVALEVSSDKYGVFYRATFMGRTGAWRRAPRDAVESVFLVIDPWEVAQAVGVMPIMNAQTDRICGRCGTPMLSEMKSCPGCLLEVE